MTWQSHLKIGYIPKKWLRLLHNNNGYEFSWGIPECAGYLI